MMNTSLEDVLPYSHSVGAVLQIEYERKDSGVMTWTPVLHLNVRVTEYGGFDQTIPLPCMPLYG